MEKLALLSKLNQLCENTLVQHLGMEITDAGSDFLCGKMPVDSRTHQPHGLLHGGASAAFAETLGSIAAGLQVDHTVNTVVGVEINCSHLRSVTSGFVYGKAIPLKLGKKIQVWEIKIHREDGKLSCISRLSVAVIKKA